MPHFHWRVALMLLPAVVAAQDPDDSGSHRARFERPDMFGSFVRAGVGLTTPLFPSGSMHNWSSGRTFAVSWESTGPARERNRVAVGVGADIGRYPLNPQQFIANFPDTTAGRPTAASAPDATLFDLQAQIRINIPAPVVTPSVLLALGYYNFHPSAVTFQSPDSTGTARYRSRSGASFGIGFAIDRQIVGPAGLFVEADYLLGASNFGFIAASSRCTYGTCEVFRNTYVGTLRTGLRVRIGS